LQRRLGELSEWSERIRSCEPTFTTSNGLFAVTCSYFHHSVLPELDYICQRTYEFVAAQSVAEAQQFISELEQFVEVFCCSVLSALVWGYCRARLTSLLRG